MNNTIPTPTNEVTHAQEDMASDAGEVIARVVFAKRRNCRKVRLTESELADICRRAARSALAIQNVIQVPQAPIVQRPTARNFDACFLAIVAAIPTRDEMAALSNEEIERLRNVGNRYDNVLYLDLRIRHERAPSTSKEPA